MDIALSLLVLTIVALVLGAFALFRRGGYRKQAVLMLVLAGVMVANVAILVVPTSGGETLAGAAKEKAPE
ncbi:hypothetical protein EDF56_101543 [Novosphingobium sp. PhB165]|uniref:hypothetical protein n=1 Tax=Novosphingobium sp. PhB165 TaxID=2485105 RepID=UPI0010536A87|nr:hypothetical protein [Novosphingobium sp. PhB165]TCM21867.1 hypothetical protein EDF56_101543 [Novosphingobium sp. PhB165]